MIRLGLRLTLSGGREAAVRLMLIAAAVALGAGLLLVTLAGVNGVNAQNGRYAWLQSAGTSQSSTAIWWNLTKDDFDGQTIGRLDLAPASADPVLPPGITHLPAPGEYYASPALAALLRTTPADQLADRFPGHLAGTIGNAALPAPNTLLVLVGRTVAQVSHEPGAVKVSSIDTTTPSSCPSAAACYLRIGINANGMDLIFSVVGLALLFPVLIFIATATRLSAARREQRYAAMRLIGATSRQVSVVAAIEASVAAITGTVAAFGLFFVLRPPLATIPWTGAPFFTSDLSLSPADIALVALGVPIASAIAALLALRRVRISPLGVTRKVTPKPPRAVRMIPLLLGVVELGLVPHLVFLRGDTGRQIDVFVPGFVLVMAGLMIAGPWLTLVGSQLMARRTSRPAALIAARRLADNPKAGFRSISGLILALFVTSVAVCAITTINVHRTVASSTLAAVTVTGEYGVQPPVSADLVADVTAVPGVTGVAVARFDQAQHKLIRIGEFQSPVSLMSCAQLDRTPALGRCLAGAQVAYIPQGGLAFGLRHAQWQTTWQAAPFSAAALAKFPSDGLFVATDGTAAAIERVQTVLDRAYPDAGGWPTIAAYETSGTLPAEWQQLANVVILASIPIAGCTLAASVAGGLTDRKRAFSLLRLTGAPLRMLQGVVALEGAVPLILVAALSIAAGFGATDLFLHAQMDYGLSSPGLGYVAIVLAALVLALAIIAATFPLLARITGPETARNELEVARLRNRQIRTAC
ncbi:MAG TPA: FtsX-like permease family protein [Streptosporangiaceae bacterium]|nr:FtsX-like permease family protein [Streptosporangiaceae bacterium]